MDVAPLFRPADRRAIEPGTLFLLPNDNSGPALYLKTEDDHVVKLLTNGTPELHQYGTIDGEAAIIADDVYVISKIDSMRGDSMIPGDLVIRDNRWYF